MIDDLGYVQQDREEMEVLFTFVAECYERRSVNSHLATALGFAACEVDHSALFAGGIEVINDLHAAQKNGGLKRARQKHFAPQLLILDEVGYLPIDQKGADLLFQGIRQRYECGSIALTNNKPFKQ